MRAFLPLEVALASIIRVSPTCITWRDSCFEGMHTCDHQSVKLHGATHGMKRQVAIHKIMSQCSHSLVVPARSNGKTHMRKPCDEKAQKFVLKGGC